MNEDRIDTRLSVIGRLPEGYVILCSQNGDEYSFLVKSLGISVECPHCGATRCRPRTRGGELHRRGSQRR
jgi:hypothetical protein